MFDSLLKFLKKNYISLLFGAFIGFIIGSIYKIFIFNENFTSTMPGGTDPTTTMASGITDPTTTIPEITMPTTTTVITDSTTTTNGITDPTTTIPEITMPTTTTGITDSTTTTNGITEPVSFKTTTTPGMTMPTTTPGMTMPTTTPGMTMPTTTTGSNNAKIQQIIQMSKALDPNSYKLSTTNLYQKNFDGASNVYSPYIYVKEPYGISNDMDNFTHI